MQDVEQAEATTIRGDRPFWLVNGVVSVLALSLLTYLLLIRRGAGDPGALSFMPAVNASFNAAAAVLLVLAVRAIKRKEVARHQALMLSAFASSSLFLVGYLAYHYVHGDTRYPGTGGARTAYLVLLASHVLLSIPVVPMCLAAQGATPFLAGGGSPLALRLNDGPQPTGQTDGEAGNDRQDQRGEAYLSYAHRRPTP